MILTKIRIVIVTLLFKKNNDNKMIFPWLEKEQLRWHVRTLQSSTTASCINNKNSGTMKDKSISNTNKSGIRDQSRNSGGLPK